MARTVRGGRLETRTARLKLPPQARAYWNPTARPGVHLGYRRLATKNGTWISRTYQGRSGVYEQRAFAQADDYAESDGDEVLTYYQAAQRIAGVAPAVRHSSAYSVQEAVGSYLEYIARHRKSIVDARSRLTGYVLPYSAHAPYRASQRPTSKPGRSGPTRTIRAATHPRALNPISPRTSARVADGQPSTK